MWKKDKIFPKIFLVNILILLAAMFLLAVKFVKTVCRKSEVKTVTQEEKKCRGVDKNGSERKNQS